MVVILLGILVTIVIGIRVIVFEIGNCHDSDEEITITVRKEAIGISLKLTIMNDGQTHS